MRRTAIATALTLLALGFAAHAQSGPTVWIASGEKGKTYYQVYGRNLISYLREFRLVRRETSGSGENLDRLASGKAQLGFVQADIYADRVRSEPDRYADVMVVGRLAPECVYIAHRKAGPVTDLAGLQAPVGDRPPRIVVGPANGGMAGTWSFMTKLAPGLAEAKVDPNLGPGTLSLNQLATGASDAVAWVTDPDNDEHVLREGVNASDQLSFMAVNDPALEHTLPDGTQIYERKRVKTGKGVLGGGHVETICTAALLMARRDIDQRLLQRVSDLLSLEREKILGRAAPRI